jgi:hypothetical protein
METGLLDASKLAAQSEARRMSLGIVGDGAKPLTITET